MTLKFYLTDGYEVPELYKALETDPLRLIPLVIDRKFHNDDISEFEKIELVDAENIDAYGKVTQNGFDFTDQELQYVERDETASPRLRGA